METNDVIVVGAGNAALCAALSAQEAGARVLVLERAPESDRGGNSAHSGGAFRTVYDGLEDLRRIVPDLTEAEIAMSDFGSYTRETYFDDCMRLSDYRANADLIQVLVDRSLPTMIWMREKGVRCDRGPRRGVRPDPRRQAARHRRDVGAAHGTAA